MTDKAESKPSVLDPETIEWQSRQPYPAPYDNALAGRARRALGDALGLTQFGVNLSRLDPGAVSSLRHWHTGEDEFLLVLAGTPTLVTDDGERVLGPGLAAGFPANTENGHRLENRSDEPVIYVEVGTRSSRDVVTYPDADLELIKDDVAKQRTFRHKDGTPY
jgi:uncharacterized cupin superfamily protein